MKEIELGEGIAEIRVKEKEDQKTILLESEDYWCGPDLKRIQTLAETVDMTDYRVESHHERDADEHPFICELFYQHRKVGETFICEDGVYSEGEKEYRDALEFLHLFGLLYRLESVYAAHKQFKPYMEMGFRLLGIPFKF